jgi:Holliday junction resolvase
MNPEQAFEKKLMGALRKQGIFVFKMNTDYPGFPDLLLFCKDRYLLLELKVMKNEKQLFVDVARKEQLVFFKKYPEIRMKFLFKCRNEYTIFWPGILNNYNFAFKFIKTFEELLIDISAHF